MDSEERVGRHRETAGLPSIMAVLMAAVIGSLLTLVSTPHLVDGQAANPADPRQPVAEKVLRAESFELVDKRGRVVGLFKSNEDTGAPTLTLYGRTGTSPRLGIALNKDGLPFISLHDAEAKPRFTIGVRSDGDVGVDLLGDEGLPQVLLRGGKNAGIGVAAGEAFAAIGWDETLKTLAWTLTGEDKKSKIVAWTPRDGKPRLEMFDSTGKRVFAGPTSPPVQEEGKGEAEK